MRYYVNPRAAVKAEVEKIAGPYDDILVKSSVTVPQDITIMVTTTDTSKDTEISLYIQTVLNELITVRKGRKLYELNLSDINHAVRSKYSSATNVTITVPEQDVKLEKDKVIILGDVTVIIRRE